MFSNNNLYLLFTACDDLDSGSVFDMVPCRIGAILSADGLITDRLDK